MYLFRFKDTFLRRKKENIYTVQKYKISHLFVVQNLLFFFSIFLKFHYNLIQISIPRYLDYLLK